MNKVLLSWLLAFFWFVTLEGLASDTEDSEEIQVEPKKVMYVLLHTDQHEFYKVKEQQPEAKDSKDKVSKHKKKASVKVETPKKEWVAGDNNKHDFTVEDNAKLTIKGLANPRSIQFLFESTTFKSDSKEVSFVYDPASFLNKIATLSPESASKKYNHLCLTLYVVYGQGNKRKIAESPLYAKWKEEVTLSKEGELKKESTAKFYTSCDSSIISGQLAYFMTGAPGNHTKTKKDSDIFPIRCSSCYDQEKCTAICDKYGEEEDDPCNDRSCCSHTEPNALFHVFKNKDKLFDPLINKAGGIESVKSIGFRFFSFYQSCTSCIQFLDTNKELTLKEKDFRKNLNFLFYFQRTYQPNTHIIKLSGKKPLKRFTNLHNNGQIFTGFPQEDKRIMAEWGDKYRALGFIQLPKEVDLNTGNRILFVQSLPEGDISKEENLKIYVVK